MKNKGLLSVIACVIMAFSMCLVGCACNGNNNNNNNNNNTIDISTDKTQEAISMVVKATSNKIELNINSSEAQMGNKTAKVVSVKAYEYLSGDTIKGLSENVSVGGYVADYTLGTQATISFDRVVSGYDSLYNKYYITLDDKILKGPVYATEIAANVTDAPVFNIKSKKGLLAENVEMFTDLNCSYATLNLDIEKFIYPNEIFEDDEEIEIDHPNNAIEFTSNGKQYYFNKALVETFDTEVKRLYDLGAHVTVAIVARSNNNDEVFPQKLTYYPWSSQGTSYMSINTSNSYGFNYWIALIEFLTERHTKNNFANGYIGNFVLGNEIDYAKDYNRISEHQASLDVYMEEYSRMLRLTNLAVKKYHSDITVCMPLTHAWAKEGYTLPLASSVQAYAPKQMVEWLNTKTKLEGDYNWGIAPHCYGYHLAQTPIFWADTLTKLDLGGGNEFPGGRSVGMTNDYNTTSIISFSNLELLEMYLNQPANKVNNKTRPVYLTESGISSCEDTTERRNLQAGAIAAVWYKISQLDSITAFNYYRLFDHQAELASSALFGLVDINQNKKPSYNVYKYIDTQYSNIVAKDYLSGLTYIDSKGVEQTVLNGGIKSYMDVLDVFETGYDFSNFDWEKATPQTVKTVYEYEDKIDLSSVKFESKSFLYDGTEKSIEAVGLPSGVTVSYDKTPTLTEVGSKTILATFTKGEEVVGHREATITVSKIVTNKTVYNYGEKIFVSISRENEQLEPDAWIGIYKKGAVPGRTNSSGQYDSLDISYFYYYFNRTGDNFIRTVCMQETTETQPGGIPAGDYVIFYFVNGGYDYTYTTELKVLPNGQTTDTIDLTNIVFSDTELTETGTEQALTISGTLPSGVTVSYVNNAHTEVGSYQTCAIFTLNGVELERRYAVLTILSGNFDRLVLNKTEFVEGEDVLVTAIAPSSSANKVWWVGVYHINDTVETDNSIYWYYVKDDDHTSGKAYVITDQAYNSTRSEYENLPAGEYKMVLFNTSGYSVEKQINFTVTAAVAD